MRILVTGGAGFTGSHFVHSLLTPSEDTDTAPAVVTMLDALTYVGNHANLDPVVNDPRLTFVQGDILDAGLVDRLVAIHDAVVNFAAESHVDGSIVAGHAFVATNLLVLQTLLQAAVRHGLRTFVHVSTDEVYGTIPTGSWTEEQPLALSSYAVSKAGADLLALSYHRTHDLDVRITRCSNNYGTHQYPEKLIPRFVTRLLDGDKAPLYGDGRHTRDWLHVEDHCRAIRLVLDHRRPGEVYDVGGGVELSNRELTRRLLEPCGADWSNVSTWSTAWAMTSDTASTGPRSGMRWVTPRGALSWRAWPRRCRGTARTTPGGNGPVRPIPAHP